MSRPEKKPTFGEGRKKGKLGNRRKETKMYPLRVNEKLNGRAQKSLKKTIRSHKY